MRSFEEAVSRRSLRRKSVQGCPALRQKRRARQLVCLASSRQLPRVFSSELRAFQRELHLPGKSPETRERVRRILDRTAWQAGQHKLSRRRRRETVRHTHGIWFVSAP